MPQFISAIIWYTITENDDTRYEFVRRLGERYGDMLCSLDQSTFSVPINEPHPASEVDAIRTIIQEMVNQGFNFTAEDTIKFACSAVRLDYRQDDREHYDKIAVYDVMNGVQPRRRRLFENR